MKALPIEDRIVTRLIEAESMTKGGIVLAPASKEEQQVAEIIAVGPGVTCGVCPGQRVVFGKYVGTEFTLHGEKQIIVRESDLLAVVE